MPNDARYRALNDCLTSGLSAPGDYRFTRVNARVRFAVALVGVYRKGAREPRTLLGELCEPCVDLRARVGAKVCAGRINRLIILSFIFFFYGTLQETLADSSRK